MSQYEIAIIAAALFAAFLGWKLGAARIAVIVASPFAAAALAPQAYVIVISRISFFSANPHFSFPAAWFLSLAALWLVAAILTKTADALMLGFVNRALGAVVFAASAFWVVSVFYGKFPGYSPRSINIVAENTVGRLSDAIKKR